MSLVDSCPNCSTSPCICKRPETHIEASGAKRDKENIPDYRLIPYKPLRRLASRYTHGRMKYGDRNWEKGDPGAWIDDCMNRSLEHISRYNSGDRTEDHLAAAAWNIFAVMFFEEDTPPCPTTEHPTTA